MKPPNLRQLLRRMLLVAAVPCAALAADAPDSGAFGVGRPGIMTEYTFGDELGFSGGSLDLQELRVLSPLWAKQDGPDIWSVSLRYTGSFLDLGNAAGFGSADLHATDLYLDYRRLPDTGFACWFRAAASLSGDFDGLSGDDFQASTMGIVGYRFSKSFGLLAGYHVGWLMDEIRAYGAIGLVWNPNDHWMIQLTPPVPSVSWSPVADWTFSLSAWPGSSAWNVHRQDAVEEVELTLWRAALGVEHRFTENFHIALRAGFNFASEIELRDASDRVLLGKSLDNAVFGAVSLRYSF